MYSEASGKSIIPMHTEYIIENKANTRALIINMEAATYSGLNSGIP